MILTAEADSIPTGAKELLHDDGLVGCHSSRSNDLSVHARINSSGYIFAFYGNQMMTETDMPQSLKLNLARRQKEQLFADLESVASAVEGSDLGLTEDPFEPTASCIYDNKRQLVTRSGLSRLRCCVCHLHHMPAMNSPAAVREFFGTVLQQVCHFKVGVIAGDANAAAYKNVFFF